MNTQLAKDIIATITYYDVLDYPLTLFEIWKYRICAENGDCHAPAPVSLEDIATCCRHRSVQKYVSCRNGMYVLCGREHLISVRKDREIISLQKIKKLRRMIAFLRISPFVRMVCVTGRLAYNNCEKDSDLDVLIVYEKGHIWTGRFLMTVLAHVCGVRRHGKKTTDRLCLNYHVTTASLEVPTQDLFGAHEYAWTFPVFDAGDIFAQFCAKNMWIAQYKPQYACENKTHAYTMGDTRVTRCVRRVGEMILGDVGMERRLRRIQKAKILRNEKTHIDGAMILCNDNHLVFLPHPHGPEVFDAYKKRFLALEISL